jgi:hypothetical protein
MLRQHSFNKMQMFITIFSVLVAITSLILALRAKRQTNRDTLKLKDSIKKPAVLFNFRGDPKIYIDGHFRPAIIKIERKSRLDRRKWWLQRMRVALLNCIDFSNSSHQGDLLRKIVTFWEFFQYLLPRKARYEAFEPAYNDLKADYLISLRHSSKWAKRWFCFCFICQTTYMIAECFRVFFGSKLKAISFILIPEGIRRFFGS